MKHSDKNIFENHHDELTYILKGILVFFNLRKQSESLLDSFINRIKDKINFYGNPNQTCTHKISLLQTIKIFLKKRLFLFSDLYSFIKYIPSFSKQKKMLINLNQHQNIINNVIIAMSSRRLHYCDLTENNIRNYLSSLSQGFPLDPNYSSVSDEITCSKNIFIFEPSMMSPFWEKRKFFWKEGVFIIDINFLTYLTITEILKMNFEFLNKILIMQRLFKAEEFISIPNRNFFTIFSIIILLSGYGMLLKNMRFKSFFFTSNSFATEILRFYLMRHNYCESICEILHGIPTIDYETYIENLSTLGSSYGGDKKLSFIPQIPNLQLYGIFKRKKYLPTGQIAINTYLNKYLLEHKKNYYQFIDFLKLEYNLLISNNIELNNQIIITFIGGGLASNNQNFSISDTFCIEQFILLHIKKIMTSINRPFILIYTPHPLISDADIQKCTFFFTNNIIVYKQTILTWPISDICISLYSSVLFESNYFGIHSFTPLNAIDNIYPSDLLNHLHLDNNNMGLENALTSFLCLNSQRKPIDLLKRAEERVKLFPNFKEYSIKNIVKTADVQA